MGSRRIGVLALLMLAGCLVASSERPALDFASEAPRLRNADLRQPSRVIRHALVGDGRIEQQHRQVFQEAGSPPRGVPAQQSPSRHMQHGRHLQQVVSWHSNVPYSAATSAETQQGTASPAVGQPMFLSWSRWRGPSAAVQTESGATGAVAPASTVRLGPGVSRRARQRWSQASQLQPPLQQLTPMLQQQQPQPEVMPDQEQPMAYAVPSATEQAATAAVAVNVEPAAVAREQADNQPEQAAPVDTMQPILSAAEVEQPDISAGTEGSLAADQGTQPLTTKQAKRKRRNAQLAASMAVDTAVAIAGLMHSQPADMPALQPADLATAAAEAASPPTVVPVHLAHPGLIAEVPSGLTPNKPSELPAPSPSPTAPQQAKFCIPATRGMQFNVLAAGDSITQGSVPSKMINHPYTIQLSQLLQRRLGKNADATDAGLGGGGIFMDGFNDPVKFGPYYQSYLSQVEWNVVVITIGINDLLRGGYPAADIMAGLQPLYDQTLAKGIPVIAIPPFAAPGFVSQTDSKEAERKKLAALITDAAAKRQAATGGKGPQIYVLDLQAGPLDFWKMNDTERSKYLDDGLHLTETAYNTLGQYVYEAVNGLLCSVQNPTITLPIPDPKLAAAIVLKP